MKILLFFSLQLLIVLAVALTSCKDNEHKAVNVEKIYLDNKCTDFFYNLGDRFPLNVKGTCGYVAVSMILEYYNYYYDNTIIDEAYIDSPYGLKRAKPEDVKPLNNLEYYHYMKANKDTLFQGLLLTEVNSVYPLYNPSKKDAGTMYNGSNCRVADYYSEHHAVLDYYLYNVKGFSEDYISTERLKGDNVRDLLIDKLKAGNPVLLNCNYHGNEGHVFICYDYDEIEDELYGNLLMENNLNHTKISSYYTKFDAAIVVTVNEKKEEVESKI